MLVIAVGNEERRDDGAGGQLAHRLRQEAPGLPVKVLRQLGPELAEELAREDAVLFVDAEVGSDGVTLRELSPEPLGSPSSHHAAPGQLLLLAEALYGRRPARCALLGIPAFELSHGRGLSPRTAAALGGAAVAAAAWIRGAATASPPPAPPAGAPRGPAARRRWS